MICTVGKMARNGVKILLVSFPSSLGVLEGSIPICVFPPLFGNDRREKTVRGEAVRGEAEHGL